MGGPGSSGICKALNCKSVRGKNEKVSFFRFPLYDADRLRIWVQRCGDIRLTKLRQEQFHCKYLCAKHFNVKSFANAKKRTRLNTGNIIPEIFTEPYLKDHEVEGLFRTPMRPREKASQIVVVDCDDSSSSPIEIIDYNQHASDIIADFLSFVAGTAVCGGEGKHE